MRALRSLIAEVAAALGRLSVAAVAAEEVVAVELRRIDLVVAAVEDLPAALVSAVEHVPVAAQQSAEAVDVLLVAAVAVPQ